MAAAASAETFVFYRYDPSMGAAVIFIILFLGITGLHTYQFVLTKTWFFIPFVLGGHLEWLGYIGRAMSAKETPDWTVGPYVMQTLLLLVAPALYAASIYMILGRIITLTESESYCIIPRKWLTKLFVVGDVLSFVLQGAGGGIMTGGSLDSMHLGERIIIIGLIIQVLFFSFFAVTAVILHMRLAQSPTRKLLAYQLDWQRYLFTLYGASALIMVRSVFRLIEYAQGNGGYLVSHEIYLYIFDSVLMLATMMLFAWQHPSEINALLNRGGKALRKGVQVFWLK